MSTQEVHSTEPTDMVTIYVTKEEAQFLLNRCKSALSVVRSNLREEAPKRGPLYQQYMTESRALTSLMEKLTEAGAK